MAAQFDPETSIRSFLQLDTFVALYLLTYIFVLCFLCDWNKHVVIVVINYFISRKPQVENLLSATIDIGLV